uniref:cGMP-dependent protein kinase interacting domain-containing protein n=1 Tax=Glossina palpalis gambiensis TaxID=67801 RepID=A0A1B0B8W6_9MUSC
MCIGNVWCHECKESMMRNLCSDSRSERSELSSSFVITVATENHQKIGLGSSARKRLIYIRSSAAYSANEELRFLWAMGDACRIICTSRRTPYNQAFQLEVYKTENLRLKEENAALIRVISKLSK